MTDSEGFKILLLKSNKNQKMLAEHLGVDEQTVGRKINNKQEWKASEIDKTCEYLNIDVSGRMEIFFKKQVD
ncbi:MULTISPECIES: DUF739 family protein [unclassified Breznakia]|uniref:DUF739 family protein n=1 Tax=unclassified Breznakia TaxID=2623764 RepID=UPI002476D7A3|nr:MULTISPECIES: DUF739 family protein [unclassified Breznakia]MDH6367521.1 DNA-binding Xre family transcriptional regulator [Breznakia sp. PH1-1]MDH6404685.1 DNA-binding Xre family transcriptional regulator [Breznakia sp. PF1-11]MDH6412351.1 DNA-binding Xre family transcriptional regulator [Breznakia sp. PFB1-11]MDH6414689.1 DNA-binding Xre family transcriptional regulator [Breznakia sp. PFB1-14]MDH6417066.1 DNA-binding Xre family transcriptional regulator [Breznakia sp. PFB1-4]